MASYVNFNASHMPSLGSAPPGVFTRVMSAGRAIGTNTWLIIGAMVVLVSVAVFYYVYYVAPNKGAFHANQEHVPAGTVATGNAELLFFYAEWCPHCKTAKPIWNDLKAEYEGKAVHGYRLTFTEVNCTQETPEIEKMVNQYNIEGYPTIKLVKDGEVIEYDAKPAKDTLVQFLNTVL